MKLVSNEWMNSFRTKGGSWSKAQMDALGVPWPQPPMWRERIVGTYVSDDAAKLFESGRDKLAASTIRRKGNAALRAEGKLPPLPSKALDTYVATTKAKRKAAKRARRAEIRRQLKLDNDRFYASLSAKPAPQKPHQVREEPIQLFGLCAVNGGFYVEGAEARSKEFLSTWAWRGLRYSTLKRYGRQCQCCGSSPETGAVMHVDHIKPRSLFPWMALDPGNTQVLCADCNVGKSNKDFTDWRIPVERAPELDPEAMSHLRSIMLE